MDSRGHWHGGPMPTRELFSGVEERRERPVIEIGIGERVQIVTAAGEKMPATFDGAEKNRVTLTPTKDAPNLYLEFGSTVSLERATGESVKAQVWENRGGRIILRTVPV